MCSPSTCCDDVSMCISPTVYCHTTVYCPSPVLGRFMEEWHQKLHNNTSPDNVTFPTHVLHTPYCTASDHCRVGSWRSGSRSCTTTPAQTTLPFPHMYCTHHHVLPLTSAGWVHGGVAPEVAQQHQPRRRGDLRGSACLHGRGAQHPGVLAHTAGESPGLHGQYTVPVKIADRYNKVFLASRTTCVRIIRGTPVHRYCRRYKVGAAHDRSILSQTHSSTTLLIPLHVLIGQLYCCVLPAGVGH